MSSERRCSNRRGIALLAAVLTLLVGVLCGCGALVADEMPQTTSVGQTEPQEQNSEVPENTMPQNHNNSEEENMSRKLTLVINGEELSVVWENNNSVTALEELVASGPITVQMSRYGGFEQVGSLGSSLPRNDVQTTTEPGDIVLYSGNQIVVFYGSNSWAYTKLGRIQGKTAAEITDLLGEENVNLTISGEGVSSAGYAIPDLVLNSGYTMPVIGLGTWMLSDDEAENSV